MLKKSLKRRIDVSFMILIAATLIVIGIFHWIFIDDIYIENKKNILIESYNEMSTVSGDDDIERFMTFCAKNNLSFVVTDFSFNVLISNLADAEDFSSLLFGIILQKETENIKVLFENENYQIVKFTDRKENIEYIELLSFMDNNMYYVVRYPLLNIYEAAQISLLFYIAVGFVMLIVSGMTIRILTKRLTKPIGELIELSGRMTNLDFEARYQSGGEDEIGQLGSNMNIMSANLENSIKELKKANAELKQDIKIKTQIDEKRREFLSNVSHELKTPIALIQGYAEGLKDMVQDAENREFYCDVIIDEANKMNRLVRQLLSLDQLESGREQLDVTRFDIAELVKGVLTASNIRIEQSGAKVINDIKSPLYVWGDEFKIEQVLTNYLSNAFNHLEGEKIIHITSLINDGTVTITVFNTGKPIPEKELDNIWSKFYKIDKARTREYGGSGIGLSIVKAIMELHSQRCWAENYENGVAFKFTLQTR
jgi:two-component system sensor histidine kinase VanS